jgi:hypothetical protein
MIKNRLTLYEDKYSPNQGISMLARGANQPEVIRPDFYRAIRIGFPGGKITSDREENVYRSAHCLCQL